MTGRVETNIIEGLRTINMNLPLPNMKIVLKFVSGATENLRFSIHMLLGYAHFFTSLSCVLCHFQYLSPVRSLVASIVNALTQNA